MIIPLNTNKCYTDVEEEKMQITSLAITTSFVRLTQANILG